MNINQIQENPLIVFSLPENEFPQVVITSINIPNEQLLFLPSQQPHRPSHVEEDLLSQIHNNNQILENINYYHQEGGGEGEDIKKEENEPSIPEVFCNLKDIEVPIDNDIIFEVDENDSIKVSSPGTCSDLKYGDMYESLQFYLLLIILIFLLLLFLVWSL